MSKVSKNTNKKHDPLIDKILIEQPPTKPMKPSAITSTRESIVKYEEDMVKYEVNYAKWLTDSAIHITKEKLKKLQLLCERYGIDLKDDLNQCESRLALYDDHIKGFEVKYEKKRSIYKWDAITLAVLFLAVKCKQLKNHTDDETKIKYTIKKAAEELIHEEPWVSLLSGTEEKRINILVKKYSGSELKNKDDIVKMYESIMKSPNNQGINIADEFLNALITAREDRLILQK